MQVRTYIIQLSAADRHAQLTQRARLRIAGIPLQPILQSGKRLTWGNPWVREGQIRFEVHFVLEGISKRPQHASSLQVPSQQQLPLQRKRWDFKGNPLELRKISGELRRKSSRILQTKWQLVWHQSSSVKTVEVSMDDKDIAMMGRFSKLSLRWWSISFVSSRYRLTYKCISLSRNLDLTLSVCLGSCCLSE